MSSYILQRFLPDVSCSSAQLLEELSKAVKYLFFPETLFITLMTSIHRQLCSEFRMYHSLTALNLLITLQPSAAWQIIRDGFLPLHLSDKQNYYYNFLSVSMDLTVFFYPNTIRPKYSRTLVKWQQKLKAKKKISNETYKQTRQYFKVVLF